MDQAQIFQLIAKQAGQGEMAFPTHARLAMKLHAALDDPDCPSNHAIKLIQAEPLLSARVVALANSVAFKRTGKLTTDLKTAVLRLGFSTVRTLAMSLLVQQLAGPKLSAERQQQATQLWIHTAHVASLAYWLAQHVSHVDPESALFAGIVHEIGGFYLLSRLDEFPGLLEQDMRAWLAGGRVLVGRAVLEALAAPPPILQAVMAYWEGYLAMPPHTLGDTLLLADQLTPVISPLSTLATLSLTGLERTDLELIIDSETLSEALAQSAAEVHAMSQALIG